jgi:hypothetical protein
MRSNELIMLKDIETEVITKILPYTEFERLPFGEYLNLNEARIIKDGKTHLVMRAGETIRNSENVGKNPPKRRKKTEVAVTLLDEDGE